MNIKAKTRPFGIKHSGWPHSKLSCLATVTEDMSGTDHRQLFRRSGSCQLWSMMVEMGWFWGLLCCLRDWAACSHWSYYEFSIIWLSAWRLCEAICLKVEAEQEVEPFNGIIIQNAQVTAPRQGSKRKKCGVMGWSGQYFTDLNTKCPAAQGVLRELSKIVLHTDAAD